MEVMEAIKGRRSIRRYKPDPISPEALHTVLEAAQWAPSWANSQCWQFVLVRDKQLKEKIAHTLRSGRPDRPNRAMEAIMNAPICIVACGELGRSGFMGPAEQRFLATDKGDWYMFDLALAVASLTLAAHSLGLGTVHVGYFDSQKVAEIVGVPPGVAVVELLPLGYPDEQPRAPLRKEIKDFTFYDRYGQGEVTIRGGGQ